MSVSEDFTLSPPDHSDPGANYSLSTLEYTNTRTLARSIREKAPLFTKEGAEKNARLKIKHLFAETAQEVFSARRLKNFVIFITSFPCAAAALMTLKNTANNPTGTMVLGSLAFALLSLGVRSAIKLDKIGATPTTEKELSRLRDKDIFYKAQDKISALKAPTPR